MYGARMGRIGHGPSGRDGIAIPREPLLKPPGYSDQLTISLGGEIGPHLRQRPPVLFPGLASHPRARLEQASQPHAIMAHLDDAVISQNDTEALLIIVARIAGVPDLELKSRAIARAASLLAASKRGVSCSSWLEQMLTRKPYILVTVAPANQTARFIRAVLPKGQDYRIHPAEAALPR